MAAIKSETKIVIDSNRNLIFDNENDLFDHFQKDIDKLEGELFHRRSKSDIEESEFKNYESHLHNVLDDPDEIWQDSQSLSEGYPYIFIKKISGEEEPDLYHVAIAYLTEEVPSFIYLHFPSSDLNLVQCYQRGDLIYHIGMKHAPVGALDGDALLEGDRLAKGLYSAMLRLRSESDIEEARFPEYAEFREETIEVPDEIWRSNDSVGHTFVYFIKEFAEEGIHYIVATIEDTPSESHALLFSFPTNDEGLVERYQHGENLQAEEVVQESSH